MLTPRERAASAYQAALAQGRGRVLGADNMVVLTEERLVNVEGAQRTIVAAFDTERHFPREPDNRRLEQMLERVTTLAETLKDDRTRWAAP